MRIPKVLIHLAFFSLLYGAVIARADKLPGHQADGSVLLPNQWSLRPAGRQVELGSFPVNAAVHSNGRYAAVLNCGYLTNEVIIVDLSSASVVSRTPLHAAFYGIVFSADGRELFCSGAGDEVVHRFQFIKGMLTNDTEIVIHDKVWRAVPCGLAVDKSGSRLFVANVWGDCVTEVELRPGYKTNDITLGNRSGKLTMNPVIPPEEFATLGADKRAEIGFYKSDPADTFPYACALDEKRERLYVSLWAQAKVQVIDLATRQKIAQWQAEDHPCELALTRSGKYLYVANANRNTVTVFDTSTGATLETIWAAFYPDAPPGSTPNSLALSPDEKTLFIANANVNAVAVFDISVPGKSRSLGFIPVGWYPTSVRVTPDGRRLLVVNGKGVAAMANPHGPAPGKKTAEYIAGLYKGALSIIDLPRGDKLEQQMAVWTADAYRCTPLKSDASVTLPRPADNPVPAKPGDTSPIKYCFYIVKENRTYDQVLGDMPQGNGDPKLCLFPESVTPNEHKLARDYVLLDNFYADAEVSAGGHEWSMAAYCSDFVEKAWPINYGHNHDGKFPYPAEGYFPIAAPASGYLWDSAKAAGVSYISYGEFISYDQPPGQPARPRVKALEGHIDPLYRAFDLEYRDSDRADRYISEFKRLDAADAMPRLQIIRLPSDHTHGSSVGHWTPTAYVADNDFALARIIELISHSRFWAESAIFIVEDDAQNGADHVDAHRTLAFIVSPYARKSGTDSTMYSTSSMLRTMELILGLQPMSQFDAAAAPMYGSFHAKPDLTPYDPVPETVDMNEKNKPTAWGADLKMDFSKEDAADDLLLNQAVWKSVRGADSPMPAPVHAAFVHARKTDDD